MKRIIFTLGILLILISVSNSQIWEQVPFPDEQATIVTIGYSQSGTLFVGTYENFYYSNDWGANYYTPENWQIDHTANGIVFDSFDHAYVATGNGGVQKSINGGQNFFAVNNGFTSTYVSSIIIDEDIIYASLWDNIFVSYDYGENCLVYGQGWSYGSVTGLAVNDDGLYATTFGEGIFKVTDVDDTWEAINTGLPSQEITAIVASPDGSILTGVYLSGVFRSDNNGNSWYPFNEGLPFSVPGDDRDLSINTMLFIVMVAILIIYAYGVYMMNWGVDVGNMWLPINDGLPSSPPAMVLARGPDESLLLGTNEEGLYANMNPVGIENHELVSNENIQLLSHTNPFANRFSFELETGESDNVMISISNLCGQVIDVLWDQFLGKGKHSFSWEPENAHPEGMYFLNISNGTDRISRKIVHLK